MWEGKVTEELKSLFNEYKKRFNSLFPDEYEGIAYYAMTYDEFIGYIKECLATGKEIPDIVE